MRLQNVGGLLWILILRLYVLPAKHLGKSNFVKV
jgi:hypothetical protein